MVRPSADPKSGLSLGIGQMAAERASLSSKFQKCRRRWQCQSLLCDIQCIKKNDTAIQSCCIYRRSVRTLTWAMGQDQKGSAPIIHSRSSPPKSLLRSGAKQRHSTLKQKNLGAGQGPGKPELNLLRRPIFSIKSTLPRRSYPDFLGGGRSTRSAY
jgi:hypothetical protein